MSTLTELKTKLEALGSLGTITVGAMPASPNVAGALYHYGGQAPEKGFGVSGIKYEHPAIQLTFRGDPYDYAGPEAKAIIAWKYLAALPPGALGSGVNTIYLFIDPQQSPFPTQPQDGNFRYYIGFNFYIMKEPT